MGPGDLDPRVDALSRRRRRRSRLHRRSARRAVFPRTRAGRGARGGRLRRRHRRVRERPGQRGDATSDPSTCRPSAAAPSSRPPTARGSASSRRRRTASRCRSGRCPRGSRRRRSRSRTPLLTRAGALDHQGIRARRSPTPAGRIVEGGSTITQRAGAQPLHRRRRETLGRKVKEACLATARQRGLEAADPRRVPERGLLRRSTHTGRRPRRRRSSREPADRLTCRRPRCSPGSRRPRRCTTRSLHPAARPRGATRCCARCSPRRITQPQLGRSAHRSHLRPGARYSAHAPQPFFGSCGASWSSALGRGGRGTAACTCGRRSTRACSSARCAIGSALARADRPGGRARRDRPADRRDPGDGRRSRRAARSQVQPRDPGAPAGGQLVQAVHADGGDGGGHQLQLDVVRAAVDHDHRPALLTNGRPGTCTTTPTSRRGR